LDILPLHEKLVSIPSPSGREGDLCRFLRDYLQEQGWEIHIQPLDSERFNIFAVVRDPVLVFSTHLDTVEPFVPYSQDERYIYGRGSCDAKGSLAAQITAAEKLRRAEAPVALLLVVGEERGSDGARLANDISPGSTFIVNGEPTRNRFAAGSLGVLRVRLYTEGRTAHSACPEEGRSAILVLLDLLNDIRSQTWPSSGIFGETTCNIGTIRGGISGNVVPDEAEAELMFRCSVPSARILKQINTLARDRAGVDVLFRCEPLRTIVPGGEEAEIVSFATDLSILTNWGKALLLGPGSIREAHTPDEKILKSELLEAVRIYETAAGKLISGEWP